MERPQTSGEGAQAGQDHRVPWFHRPRKPHRFGDLPEGAWKRIAKRTFDQYRADGVTNLAAALTYRSVLSLFPGMIAFVALLGLVGEYPQTFNAVLQIAASIVPPTTVQTISGPVRHVITNKGGAGALLGIGLVVTVWAASGYVGAFSWAANVMWEASRGRSWYRQWPFNIAVTLVALALATFVLSGLVLTGPVARAVGSQLGVGSLALEIWSIAKWPAIVVVVTLMISGLYYIAPNVRPPSWRWLTPGAVLAVIAWAITSAGFGVYIANFNSYNKAYGTLGAVVTFLIWVWLTNTAILLGVELDTEIERERQLSVDQPGAADRIQLPLRQE
ncbi:MAG: YihY/virulence factor BrkB family protein [Solirubrobacterales bacterium]|nr:YihY/virulence factor BrkB family protein [Solirubrobacterales bacterium]